MADAYTFIDTDNYLWTHTDDVTGAKSFTVRNMHNLRSQKLSYDNQSAIALAAITVGVGIGCVDPG